MSKRIHTEASSKITDMCARMPTGEQHELRELLARLLDKWSLWVLAELCADGPLRFSRLLERLEGVTRSRSQPRCEHSNGMALSPDPSWCRSLSGSITPQPGWLDPLWCRFNQSGCGEWNICSS